jgi:hypothetical protein
MSDDALQPLISQARMARSRVSGAVAEHLLSC